MINRIVEKASGFIRELREYASPFYYGASTNAIGGVLFGLFSQFFNPGIPMPQMLPHLFLRVLFGAGAGIAYSLGAFCFSLPYMEAFANSINKHVKSETARDVIYSFLSLGASLLILVAFAYFLFVVYSGRIPVKVNQSSDYLFFPWFISSLSHANWAEIASIPVSGILMKGFLRTVRRLF